MRVQVRPLAILSGERVQPIARTRNDSNVKKFVIIRYPIRHCLACIPRNYDTPDAFKWFEDKLRDCS